MSGFLHAQIAVVAVGPVRYRQPMQLAASGTRAISSTDHYHEIIIIFIIM
jgi:hypothetical protein